MAHLRKLPEHATVFDVFSAYPHLFTHIADFSQEAFRGPGELSPRDREMIFSYVSQLNACEYCFGGHAETTVLLGAKREVFDKLKIDIDTAPVDAKLRPLLHYAKKLTQTPARMTQADTDACYAAGWGDEAIMQAVTVCCLANFMNRLVEGAGVHADPSKFAARAKSAVENGYQKPFRQKMAALQKTGA